MVAEPVEPITKTTLSHPSPSFRLRSKSLNALRLRRVFDVFDHNSDGFISVLELHRALEQLGLITDLSELEMTVQSYIKPGNPGLQYDDFDALHRSLGDAFFGTMDGGPEPPSSAESDISSVQEETDLKEAFKVFDENGDGYISAKELQIVLSKLGMPEGREIDCVRQMICSVDENRDGLVDFVEFKRMMQSIVVQSS